MAEKYTVRLMSRAVRDLDGIYRYIAEKPSVGKAIAAVLGAHGREDGCFIGNGYVVSWCFGHLAELVSAEVYDEKYGKWRCEDLPILPRPWRCSISHQVTQHTMTVGEYPAP